MAVLHGMPTIPYLAHRGRLFVHKLFITYIRLGLVSRDSIVNGDLPPVTE